MQKLEVPINRFRNNAKAVELGMQSFKKARSAGVLDQYVRLIGDDRLETREGHQFVTFSSCNYLGLASHPKLIEGAASMIREQGFTFLAMSVVRVCADVHKRAEEELSQLWRANCAISMSCSAGSEGLLPLMPAACSLTACDPLWHSTKTPTSPWLL